MNRRTLQAGKYIVKALVMLGLAGAFSIEYATVIGITAFWQYLYGGVMFVCLVAFGLTLFAKIRKAAYAVFAAAFISYLLMNAFVPEIKNERNSADCLEIGQIWDPVRQECR